MPPPRRSRCEVRRSFKQRLLGDFPSHDTVDLRGARRKCKIENGKWRMRQRNRNGCSTGRDGCPSRPKRESSAFEGPEAKGRARRARQRRDSPPSPVEDAVEVVNLTTTLPRRPANPPVWGHTARVLAHRLRRLPSVASLEAELLACYRLMRALSVTQGRVTLPRTRRRHRHPPLPILHFQFSIFHPLKVRTTNAASPSSLPRA